MTTTSDLIESTRHHFLTGQPEHLNTLSANITSGATSFALTYPLAGLQAGTILSIELEEIFVFTVENTSQSVTACQRGYNGSTQAAHSSGAIVTVQPKVSPFRILEAINNDLKDLSSPINGLFQIKTVDITFNPVRYGYDMTSVTNVISIAEVRYRTPGPQKTWPKIENYTLARSMPTTGTYGDFASGLALMIYEPAFPGLPIHVRYRAPFDELSSLSQNVEAVTGLPGTALDIPPLGAAVRLGMAREIRRNFDEAQGEPRRAEEVPPQAMANSVRGLMALRQARIQAEAVRLQRQYSFEVVGA